MAESKLRIIVETQDRELSKLQGDLKKTDKAVEDLNGANKKLERSFRGVDGAAGKAANGINKTGRAAKGAKGQVDGLNRSIRNLVTGAALLAGARFIFSKTAELERTTKQLATVTGSLETAKGILNELQVINKKSPFSFIELADTAKRLSAFGIANKDLVGSTERLGKAAAATGARVNELALAYGQVAAKGKLQTEELYQFQERGIPLLDELAKGYGKTKGEVQELITAGRVGFPAVEQAIKNLTTGNGKFAKSFENTAETLDAKLSNAIDSLGRAAAAFGELLKPTVLEALKGAEELLTGITGLLKAIPEPAAKVALQFGAVALQVLAVNKALKILVGLKAGVAATLAATSGGLTAAGTAAKVANPFLFKAKALLVSLANIGFITIGVNIVINGLQALADLERRFNNIANVSSNDFGKLVGGAALSTQEIDKLVKENRNAVQKKTDELGGIRFPFLTGKDEALEGELLQLEARYAKLRTMRERAIYGTPEDRAAADLKRNGNPFELEDPKLDGKGKGKGKGKGRTATPATDDLRALQNQIDLTRDLMVLQGQRIKEEMKGNDLAVLRIDGQIQLRELQASQADAMAGMNTEAGRLLQTTLSQLQTTQQIAANEDQIALAKEAQATAVADALRPLEEQRAILEATLNGKGEEKRLELEINRILRDNPGLQREKVEALVKGNAELQKQIDQAAELEQLYAQIGQRVADGLVEGITAAIDGTKSLQEVLADVLKDVGKMFLQFGIKAAFGGLGIPGFADGGRPEPNKLSIVGEEGPELFVPDTAGTVFPNDAFDVARGAMGSGSSSSEAFAENTNSIAATNNYMRELSVEREMAAKAEGSDNQPIRFETTMINSVEYVSKAEAFEIGRQSAKQAKASVLSDMKNKPAIRRQVGVK